MIRMDKLVAFIEPNHRVDHASQRTGDRYFRGGRAERQSVHPIIAKVDAERRLLLRDSSLRRHVMIVLGRVNQTEPLAREPALDLCHLISSWCELLPELRGGQIMTI